MRHGTFFFWEIMKDDKPMDFQDSRSTDLSNLNPPEAQMEKTSGIFDG